MATSAVGNALGFSYLHIFTKNSSGYSTGQAGASPANGTTSHSYETRNVSTANFSPSNRSVIQFEQGDAYAGSYSFPGSGLQPFDITGDAEDGNIISLVTGNNLDTTTVSGWQIYSSDSKRVILRDVGIMITTIHISRVSASSGTKNWRNVFIPNCQIACTIGGGAFQNKVPFTMNVTPGLSSKFPNGIAFGTNQSWQDNETDHYVMITENPLSLTTFISDAAATTFIARYRPPTNVVTVSTRPSWFARNGVAAALNSFNTTTALATMASAGSAGDVNILIHEHLGVAP